MPLSIEALIFSAVFADFLSPYDPAARDSDRVFYPPQGIHFFDEENNFSLRPFSFIIFASIGTSVNTVGSKK